jgi:hypothetical protein
LTNFKTEDKRLAEFLHEAMGLITSMNTSRLRSTHHSNDLEKLQNLGTEDVLCMLDVVVDLLQYYLQDDEGKT